MVKRSSKRPLRKHKDKTGNRTTDDRSMGAEMKALLSQRSVYEPFVNALRKCFLGSPNGNEEKINLQRTRGGGGVI